MPRLCCEPNNLGSFSFKNGQILKWRFAHLHSAYFTLHMEWCKIYFEGWQIMKIGKDFIINQVQVEHPCEPDSCLSLVSPTCFPHLAMLCSWKYHWHCLYSDAWACNLVERRKLEDKNDENVKTCEHWTIDTGGVHSFIECADDSKPDLEPAPFSNWSG